MNHFLNKSVLYIIPFLVPCFCKLLTISILCGVGGSRTLVQTRRKSAFYTFILCLIFDRCMAKGKPNSDLSSKISFLYRGAIKTISTFPMFLADRRRDWLSGKQPAAKNGYAANAKL